MRIETHKLTVALWPINRYKTLVTTIITLVTIKPLLIATGNAWPLTQVYVTYTL